MKSSSNFLFKTENDFQKSVYSIIDDAHKSLDSIFSNIVEHGHDNSSMLMPGDVVSALQQAVFKIFDIFESVNPHYRIDSVRICSPFMRILCVQESNPIKDLRAPHNKAYLVSLHIFAWEHLTRLSQYFNIPSLDAHLDLFINRYHLSITQSDVFISILRYLCISHGQENMIHCRKLVQLVIECLKVAPKTENKSALTKSTKKKLKLEEDEQATLFPVQVNCLEWTTVAFKLASVSSKITSLTKQNLVNALWIIYPRNPTRVLSALGSIVLFNQPAAISTSTPLLMHLIKSAIWNQETRNVAMDIAEKLDFIIRPRRPFAPNRPFENDINEESFSKVDSRAALSSTVASIGGFIIPQVPFVTDPYRSTMPTSTTDSQSSNVPQESYTSLGISKDSHLHTSQRKEPQVNTELSQSSSSNKDVKVGASWTKVLEKKQHIVDSKQNSTIVDNDDDEPLPTFIAESSDED